MPNDIKVLNYTQDNNPDLLAVANELARLERRKPHDAIRLLILRNGKARIAQIQGAGQEKSKTQTTQHPVNGAMRPKCQDSFNAAFARNLAIYLGGDPQKVRPNWCWREFGLAYPELREKIERYLATAKTGNPSWGAYWMCRDCGSTRQWAQKVIARAKTGDPAWAAYAMSRDCGSPQEWAQKVIERVDTGDPAWAAYGMCRDCGSLREWAEMVIERADIGDPAWAAYGMCRDCASPHEWAQKVIGRAKTGDPAWAAFVLSTLNR
jgi:nitrate/TMAO reductase-like tetraheme cytochrome c subunit